MSDTATIWRPDQSSIPQFGQSPAAVEETLPVAVGQVDYTLTTFAFVVGSSNLQLFLSGQRLHPATYTEGADGKSFTLLFTPAAIGEILARGSLPETLVGTELTGLQNCLNDAAAAAAGVPVNFMYHNNGALRVRLT